MNRMELKNLRQIGLSTELPLMTDPQASVYTRPRRTMLCLR